MTVLIPRIRTINVRLSEDEYLELERYCVSSGARSISDLVRNTMHNVLLDANRDTASPSIANDNSAKINYLEQKVDELVAKLSSFQAGVQMSSKARLDEPKEPAETQALGDAEA